MTQSHIYPTWSDEEKPKTLSYQIATWSVKCLAHILCRIDADQLARVPKDGPLIVVMNHVNFLEGPIVYTHLLPRRMTGFVKSENLGHPFFGTLLIDLWEGIPLRRGEADTTAFRQALLALEAGRILAVAPEGARSGHGRLQQGHPGIAFLALRSGVPVLPMACHGGEIIWDNIPRLRRTDFHVAVGQPFHVDTRGAKATRRARQQIADEIMYQVAALLPPAYRGVYELSAATETYIHFEPGVKSNIRRARG